MLLGKITITVTEANGQQNLDILIETVKPKDNVRGVEVIQVLNNAIAAILDEII